jgi:hypothetical protein
VVPSTGHLEDRCRTGWDGTKEKCWFHGVLVGLNGDVMGFNHDLIMI